MSENYIDVKCTIWQRFHYTDKSKMQKLSKIIEKSGNINDVIDDDLGFKEMETLFDTEEYITPEENKGPTIEVYENNELIYENFKYIE